MKHRYPSIIDELTDFAAIIAIAAIVILSGVPSNTVLYTIATIALGKRVINK